MTAATTAFVLGGGGNLGATQVGMLRALIERDITPDVLIGCSVGAINAAGLAADPTLAGVDYLTEMWQKLDGDTICPPGRINSVWLLTRKYRSMQNNHGLRRLLETSLPYTSFHQAKVPLHVVTTSLRTGQERWFCSGPIVPPLLASAAIPAVFPPVVIHGEPLVDGAVVNNVPIDRAIALGATRIVVLHVGNFNRPRREPRRPLEALLQSFSIARNHRFLMETAATPRHVELLVLPALDPGNSLRYHDFSRAHVLIDRAHRLAADHLDAGSYRAAG